MCFLYNGFLMRFSNHVRYVRESVAHVAVQLELRVHFEYTCVVNTSRWNLLSQMKHQRQMF